MGNEDGRFDLSEKTSSGAEGEDGGASLHGRLGEETPLLRLVHAQQVVAIRRLLVLRRSTG